MKNLRTIRQYHEANITPRATVLFWNQIFSSILYRVGIFKGTSKSKPKEKKKMLEKIRSAFMDEKRCNYDHKRINDCMKLFSERLEDPGLLKNAYFFCIDESDFMLTFYTSLWEGKVGQIMEYLHGYGWNLNGEYVKIPETDVWSMMIEHELMSIDARKKATNVIRQIRAQNPARSMSLGCGQVIEGHYGLFDILSKNQLILIDKDVPKLNRDHGLQFVQMNLFDALKEYQGQNFIWMTGVWPYFSDQEQLQVLVDAAIALEVGGHFMFDQVVINPSLLRAALTQGWPRDPQNPMRPKRTAKEAIKQAAEVIERANEKLIPRGIYLKTEEVSVIRCGKTNEKGYPTSVQFVLKRI